MTGVGSFTELDCWQLSNELKLGVYALIQDGPAARDFDFRDQIKDAAASAPRNIAEAFGRYEPNEIKQYLRVATGSLMETSNHLTDGVDRGYFRQTDLLRSCSSRVARPPQPPAGFATSRPQKHPAADPGTGEPDP
jgi:four helix bundle protein